MSTQLLSYVAILLLSATALLGLKKDWNVHSKMARWTLFGVITAALAVGILSTRSAQTAATENKGEISQLTQSLRSARGELQEQHKQLESARQESAEGLRSVVEQQRKAQDANIRKFGTLLATEEKNVRRVTKNLETSSNILQRKIVGGLSEAKELILTIFFDGVDPSVREDYTARAGSNPQDDHDFALKQVFCDSSSTPISMLQVPITNNPNLYFEMKITKTDSAGGCQIGKRLRSESVAAPEHQLDLSPVVIPVRERMLLGASIDNTSLSRLVGPFRSLTMNSLEPPGDAFFGVPLPPSPEESKRIIEHFQRILPRTVGVNIVPNFSDYQFESTWRFELESEPAITRGESSPLGEARFRFKKAIRSSEWDVCQFLGEPVCTPKK